MSELEIAEGQTKTDLTKTQKENGQYQKGKVVLKNIPIVIESPKGSFRSGVSPEGKYWKSELYFTYGYIENTIGSDGDEIDIFLGPLAGLQEDFLIYIVNQIDPITKVFDEHKVMFGFSTLVEAKEAYLSCYEKGWTGLGTIDQVNLINFSSWVKSSSINLLNTKTNEVVENQREDWILIKLEKEVIEDQTLLDLQKQAGDLKSVGTLVIEIASPGGDVSEGIKIMMWMDYLSSLGIRVVTIVTANAYSIASLIMLAADYTLIAKDADVMVHNPMIPELKLANANELEVHLKSLRELESTMYELYEVFTDLSIEQIKELMDNETYFSAEKAVELGFADEVANIEKRPKVMAVKKLNTINMKKTLNILNKVIALVGNSNILNQSYYDETGGSIEIYQQDPSCYKTGDRTSLESGVVKLQDGSVVTISDYVITEIEKEAMTTPPAASEPPVVPPAIPAEPAPVAGFNEGPAPVVSPATEKMKTEVTTTETTKTEPVAVASAPAEPAPVVPPVEGAEEREEDPMTMILNKLTALGDEVAKLSQNYSQIVAKQGESQKFEELASEAIDMLAKNTVSNFKPAARAGVEEAPKGSIFQQMKAKAAAAKAASGK